MEFQQQLLALWLQARGELDVLVLDCLFEHRKHPTHFNLSDAIATIRTLRPKVREGLSCVLLIFPLCMLQQLMFSA